MSKTIFQKIAVTAASVLLGVAGMEVKPTQAATAFWDLTFFDDDGKRVGSGEFSYNSDTLTLIPTDYPAFYGYYVTNVLESFSANIDGVEWDREGSPCVHWWNTSDPVGPFAGCRSRYSPIPGVENRWLFGDLVARFPELAVYGDLGGRRYWQHSFYDDQRQYREGSGTWTATLRRVDIPNLGFSIYTDRSAWEDAVSALGASFTTETFDNAIPNARDIDYSGGTITERGDVRREITFDNGIISKAEGNGAFFVNEIENGVFRGTIDTNNDVLNPETEGEFSGAITWTFPSPVIGFGADWSNIGPGEPLTISGNFDGKQNHTVSLYPKLATARNEFGGLIGNGSGFLGIVSKGTFSQVTLQGHVPGLVPQKEDFEVDNLSLATAPTPAPIPEPGTILALAAFSLTGLATKKKLASSKAQLPS
ncbi:MAG TPA: hypothetical protein V6C95_17800 [Coleofasciculaceae cyanobacterium]